MTKYGQRRNGKVSAEFLSFHSTNQIRINSLNAKIPGVLILYQQEQAAGKRPQCKA
ncbi:MAG: hypothetical protein JKY93_00460 [Gammaproteobacteria bacterium]|nr:hypothetical protein [Gammaproteobacteria bacterium]